MFKYYLLNQSFRLNCINSFQNVTFSNSKIWPLLCISDRWQERNIFQWIFWDFNSGDWCLVLVFEMLNSKLIEFSPPSKHCNLLKRPNAFQYISMVYSSVDDSCIFHKTPLSSRNNNTKRNPEELIWKRGKYHFLIFSNYNPPWLVIPATPSSSTSSSSFLPVRVDGGKKTSLPNTLLSP